MSDADNKKRSRDQPQMIQSQSDERARPVAPKRPSTDGLLANYQRQRGGL